MTPSALEISGLGYAYPDGRRAVEDVTFRLEAGESLGVVGPNGAGKTTLLLLLSGLLDPGCGKVLVFGRPHGQRDEKSVRRHLGFVFQETQDQLFSPTVFDDVAFGLIHFAPDSARRDLDEVRDRVARALAQVGLPGYESRVPHHLSSGEQRRVALATVLSYEPDVLILDEPSNDLDPRGRRDLARLLRATRQGRIIASHDIEFVLRTCERIIVMDRGQVRADGPAVDVLCDTAMLEAYGLELPLGLRGLDAPALRGVLEDDRSRS